MLAIVVVEFSTLMMVENVESSPNHLTTVHKIHTVFGLARQNSKIKALQMRQFLWFSVSNQNIGYSRLNILEYRQMDRDQNTKCLLAQKLKRYSLFQCIGRISSSTDILLQFLPLGHSIQVKWYFLLPSRALSEPRPDVYSRDIMLAISQSLGMFENLIGRSSKG